MDGRWILALTSAVSGALCIVALSWLQQSRGDEECRDKEPVLFGLTVTVLAGWSVSSLLMAAASYAKYKPPWDTVAKLTAFFCLLLAALLALPVGLLMTTSNLAACWKSPIVKFCLAFNVPGFVILAASTLGAVAFAVYIVCARILLFVL